MKKILSAFGLTTVRKKTLLLSKLVGGIIVLFYLFTSELPTNRSFAFLIWFLLMASMVLTLILLPTFYKVVYQLGRKRIGGEGEPSYD